MEGEEPCPNDIVSLDLVPMSTTSSSSSSSSLSIDVDESAETRIQRLILEHPVVIFARSSCCMCHVMKNLLATLGAHPAVIQLEDHEISALPSPTTISPALFIGGSLIGGLDSLLALHVSGHLVPKLLQVGALSFGIA